MPDHADTARLNRMADAITSVCGWLPLSVRYDAAKAALARVDVFGATCPWCGGVGAHNEFCMGFEVNDPARIDGSEPSEVQFDPEGLDHA